MDISDVKRLNLHLLVIELGRDVVARKLGFDSSNYLNQVVNGHASCGPSTTKKIYSAFDLPSMWLETPHHAQWNQYIEHFNQKDRQLIRELRGERGAIFSSIESDLKTVLTTEQAAAVFQLIETFRSQNHEE